MSTKIVNLSATDWTAVSTAASGSIENTAGCKVKYRAAAVKPDAAVVSGHSLGLEQFIGFALSTGETLYARTIAQAGDLVVTE